MWVFRCLCIRHQQRNSAHFTFILVLSNELPSNFNAWPTAIFVQMSQSHTTQTIQPVHFSSVNSHPLRLTIHYLNGRDHGRHVCSPFLSITKRDKNSKMIVEFIFRHDCCDRTKSGHGQRIEWVMKGNATVHIHRSGEITYVSNIHTLWILIPKAWHSTNQ